MTIGFDQDLADAMAFQRHFAETNKHIRKSVKVLQYAFPAILMGFALAITPWNVDALNLIVSLLPAALIAVLWLVFVPKWYMRSLMRKTRRIMQDPGNAKLYGRREMTLDEEGIRVKTADVDETIKWSAIVQWDETPDYYFLYLSTSNAYGIPKRKLARSDVEALRSLFNTQVLSKR